MTAPDTRSFLEWRDEWTPEVGFMDEDHRHLAHLFNRLASDYGAPDKTPAAQDRRVHPLPLPAALDELVRAARLHFAREEAAMRRDLYEGFDDHKADHDLLLAELSVLVRELAETNTPYLDQSALDTLKDWLLGHALDFDRRLSDFIAHPDRPGSSPTRSD